MHFVDGAIAPGGAHIGPARSNPPGIWVGHGTTSPSGSVSPSRPSTRNTAAVSGDDDARPLHSGSSRRRRAGPGPRSPSRAPVRRLRTSPARRCIHRSARGSRASTGSPRTASGRKLSAMSAWGGAAVCSAISTEMRCPPSESTLMRYVHGRRRLSDPTPHPGQHYHPTSAAPIQGQASSRDPARLAPPPASRPPSRPYRIGSQPKGDRPLPGRRPGPWRASAVDHACQEDPGEQRPRGGSHVRPAHRCRTSCARVVMTSGGLVPDPIHIRRIRTDVTSGILDRYRQAS